MVLNLLERELLVPGDGIRPDLALAYLCRYIGWHNGQAVGEAQEIVLLPTLLAGKTGVMMLADLGLRWLHPVKAGSTVGVLILVIALALQLLGQKRNDDQYAHCL